MKKILIIGASTLQLPAILKAKEMGFYVGVLDINSEAIGIKFADEFFNVSTIDVVGMLQVAKKFKPNGIMTLATDMPIQAIAVSTTELGLQGLSVDVAIKATNKIEMLKAFKKHNVESPWFYEITSLTDLILLKSELSFPFILKPCDNSGSRGVILVESEKDIKTAFHYSKQNSRNGIVIAEEFLEGKEVSVEVLVIDHNIHILAITDKITTGPPHFVEMGHSQPSQLNQTAQNKIKKLTINAINAIGIINGPAHVEIMLTPKGPKMIEIGARMGGDNITTHLIPLSTGIDMVKATIQLSIGEKPNITQRLTKASAIYYFNTTSKGIIQTINGVDEASKIDGIKEITFTKQIGDRISNINSSLDRIGFVITQKETVKDAIKLCKKVASKIEIIGNE